MALVVNTNVMSINAQRNLNKVTNEMDKAMERLASGLRINRAGDDAAGLAISNALQAQTRGLSQAIRNSSDALSLVGVAEGTFQTQTTILQRIRELSVQAANDVNSADNRRQIQEEIDAQISELTRLGNTTEFNGHTLLNGTFQSQQIQVGAYASQTITVSLSDFRAAGMGDIAETTSTQDVDDTVLTGGTELQINSVDVAASQDDGVSYTDIDASALAKANAINEVYGQTGVRAEAQATEHTAAINITGAGIIAGDSMTINGVSIFSGETFTIQADDADGTLTNKINAKSNETGVVAERYDAGAAYRMKLTAADGRNISTDLNGVTAAETGVTDGNGSTIRQGRVKLVSTDDFTIGGTGSAVDLIGIAAGTYATDPNKRVNKIDVTTQAGASTAIDIIDSALAKVADAQAGLGALTNRLENTISNLEISIENLTASESRIRDADFAAETAALTRAQIIQQAGTSVLTQANVRPQAALALLG